MGNVFGQAEMSDIDELIRMRMCMSINEDEGKNDGNI